MATNSSPPPIARALRDVRVALRLRQSDFAERMFVARETVSSWEQGRTEPDHGQRVAMVERLTDAPPEVLARLVQAFGIAAPAGWQGAAGPGAPGAAPRVLAAIRAAADELDVPASSLRRMLVVTVAQLTAAGVSLDDVARALAPKGGPAR